MSVNRNKRRRVGSSTLSFLLATGLTGCTFHQPVVPNKGSLVE